MDLARVKAIVEKDSSLARIDAFLQSTRYSSSSKAYSHKPSSLGSRCYRKIYYSYFRVPEPTPETTKDLRIFAVGHALEDVMINWFKAIGEFIPYTEKETGRPPLMFGKEDPQFQIWSDKWRIKLGKIDNVAKIKGETWLYEFKTINANKFRSLKEPLPEHMVQVAIYFQTFNDLYLSGAYDHIPEIKGAGKAKGVRFYYFCKDNSDIKEFLIDGKNPGLIKTVLETDRKIAQANKFIDAKVLPPKTPDNCRYCAFAQICEKNSNPV